MRCRSRSQNLGSVHSGKRLLGERHPAPPVKEDPEDLLRALRTAMAAAASPPDLTGLSVRLSSLRNAIYRYTRKY